MLCGLAVFAVSLQVAFAHAEPALVKPGNESVLTSPPSEVSITMSQEMFDDGKGGKTSWEIEGRPPGVLARAGWSKTILKAGDTITVDFSPARDGSHSGLTTRVTLADGTVLSQVSPGAL